MKRRFLRHILKPATLAFAVSLILVPSAIAMPLQSVGGSGTAGTQKLGPRDGWYTRATEAQPNIGPRDGWYTRAIEPQVNLGPRDGWYNRAVEPVTTGSPGRVTPDFPPASTVTPVASQPDGFDWTNALIGTAGALLLVSLLAAMALVAVRHRSAPLAHR